MRELTSQATALFGIPGQDLAPVIDQVVRTVEVVGRPLSIGHIVESTGIGAIFTAITNTYSPYMIVGGDALDPSRDGVIRGQDYQEVLTNFPLGSQILTGLFSSWTWWLRRHHPELPADGRGSDRHCRAPSRRHRSRHDQSSGAVPRLPVRHHDHRHHAGAVRPERADLRDRPASPRFEKSALEFQAQLAATSPGPAQTLLARRANDVMRDGMVAMGRSRLLEFASISDEFTAGMARSTKVVAYFDSPRISIFQTRAEFSPAGLLSFSFAIDLRRTTSAPWRLPARTRWCRSASI